MAALNPRVTAFAAHRQALDGHLPDALTAVGAAVGVYSSMPSGPLSIRVRSRDVTADDVRALETDRRVVRMRAMRTSAFLVPLGSAAAIAAATAVPPSRFGWLMRAAGIDDGGLPAVRAAVLRVAAEPGTPADLRARLAATGLDEAAAPWTSGQALGRVLSLLTGVGDLAAIGGASLSSNALRYVAREVWFGPAATATSVERAAARAWLAGSYLRAFGPARVEDLVWWAAWSRAQVFKALATHVTVDVGAGLLVLDTDLAAFEATMPLDDSITLLPKWDAWTMAYPLDGRSRFVDHDVHDRVFDGDGNGLAMILRAGRAIGAWAHRGEHGSMTAHIDLFERVPASTRAIIEEELASIAVFLGYRGLVVREVASVVPNRRRQRRPLETR